MDNKLENTENTEINSILSYYEELKTQPDSYFANDDTLRWM